ncbi:MAG: hypothetical protein PHR35_05840 [Kiritimatiellae bacterium]|nr:hypothetical protein [Kiritimatiellia bacterium]
MSIVRTREAIETRPPEIDLEKRILRGVVAMTDRLASDGAIVLMRGLDTKERFEPNPIVQAKHARSADASAQADVIGRAIELTRGEHELVAVVQFADTQLGREYAYLYGVNPEREVFMRAWSGGFSVRASDFIAAETARQQYAAQWDADVYDALPSWASERIEIVSRSSLSEFSAVGRGADKAALTRALRNGCRAAGDVIAAQDADDLRQMLAAALAPIVPASLKRDLESIEGRLLALEGKGAAAVLQGNTAELRAELESLMQMVRK